MDSLSIDLIVPFRIRLHVENGCRLRLLFYCCVIFFLFVYTTITPLSGTFTCSVLSSKHVCSCNIKKSALLCMHTHTSTHARTHARTHTHTYTHTLTHTLTASGTLHNFETCGNDYRVFHFHDRHKNFDTHCNV